jgi:hypothetical protein
MTPEEIEAMEASIPEWKKNALVAVEEESKPEKEGVFKNLKSKLG